MDTTNNINVIIGYDLFENLSFEGEYIYGFNSSSSWEDDLTGEFKSDFTNHTLLLNTVINHTFFEKHTPYIKLGIGYSIYKNDHEEMFDSKHSNKKDIYKYKYEGQGITYKLGIGYEYSITINHKVSLEYNYIVTPDIDLTEKDMDDNDKWKLNGFAEVSYSTINILYKYSF